MSGIAWLGAAAFVLATCLGLVARAMAQVDEDIATDAAGVVDVVDALDAVGTPDVSPVVPPAVEADIADVVRKAHAVLLHKCGECHASDVRRPKGEFGYVDDFARLAANLDLVVPGDASFSLLYMVIESGEMPPKSSAAGPMSEDDMQAVAAWINLGAPTVGLGLEGDAAPVNGSGDVDADVDPDVAVDEGSNDGSGAGDAAAGDVTDSSDVADGDDATPTQPRPSTGGHSAEPTTVEQAYDLTGKLHPLMVHWPIAMLIGAFLAECLTMIFGREKLGPAVTFMLVIGTLGAGAAVASGWIFADIQGYAEETADRHRWTGVATLVWAVVTFVLLMLTRRSAETVGLRRIWFRIALFMLAILVGLTGHFGGILTWGKDHLPF